jgi:putative Mg2+ transporter-C (MgtC) family protein
VSGLPVELDLIVRLLVAALVGAGVGLEREIHGHPAGLRTHLLVSVGSAVFTILSFHGFAGLAGGAAIDPTRIAAQVVSGIGFLGAGAIIKEGFSIRGLTTAASLWGTAALGMAAALGEYALAGAGVAIVVISLWPLNPIADRLEGIRGTNARVVLEAANLEVIGMARSLLERSGLEVGALRTRRLAEGHYSAEAMIRHGGSQELYGALTGLAAIDGVTVTAVDQGE